MCFSLWSDTKAQRHRSLLQREKKRKNQLFWYIICIKGGIVYLYTWKKLFKCMQHWHRGFKMCTADKNSPFWRGPSPPAPSSLDSKLKWLARLRKLNEHQRKVIWAQHDKRGKHNNYILTLKSNNVSFPLSWSADIHALWIQWCLRMVNQLIWHLSWNPSGLLTDFIFEMQLPSLTCVLAGRLSWWFSKEDQAF